MGSFWLGREWKKIWKNLEKSGKTVKIGKKIFPAWFFRPLWVPALPE